MKRKEETRNSIPDYQPVITGSSYYANDLQKDTTVVNIAKLAKASRILIGKISDQKILIVKREMLGLPFDEHFLISDAL